MEGVGYGDKRSIISRRMKMIYMFVRVHRHTNTHSPTLMQTNYMEIKYKSREWEGLWGSGMNLEMELGMTKRGRNRHSGTWVGPRVAFGHVWGMVRHVKSM